MAKLSLRETLPQVYQAALKAVEPEAAVTQYLESMAHGFSRYRKVFLAGIGKAAVPMARAVENVLGSRLEAGRVIVKDGHGGPVEKTIVAEASHPEPDERGRLAALELVSFLKESLTPEDLLIFVVSGGGSALLPLPAKGLTLEDKQVTTAALLRCGATIQEINTIRKHLSLVKGGRLLNFTNGAAVLGLVLSDVIGDGFGDIASGPTAPDPSTFEDCLRIIQRYDLGRDLPPAVVQYLFSAFKDDRQRLETLKNGDPRFEKVRNVLVANNLRALEAARDKAEELGYPTLILSSSISGDTSEVAGQHIAIAREILSSGNPAHPPCCVISGGETTVKLKGGGKGGRNMEFVLRCASLIEDLRNVPLLIASLGTDGTDGPTDAAGALVTPDTLWHARTLGLKLSEYLAENDSYHFFQRLGDLILTGPTQTNVMDIRIMLFGETFRRKAFEA